MNKAFGVVASVGFIDNRYSHNNNENEISSSSSSRRSVNRNNRNNDYMSDEMTVGDCEELLTALTEREELND